MELPNPYPPLQYSLPNDEGLRKRLEAKLLEYRERHQEYGGLDSYYKVMVLSELLNKGEVDVKKLEEQEMEQFGVGLEEYHTFLNAVGVIFKYSNMNGYNVVDGTGLPK